MSTRPNNDDLLQAQGIMVVYYLLFKGAVEADRLDKITRKKLPNYSYPPLRAAFPDHVRA